MDVALRLIETLLTKVAFGILKLIFYTIPKTIFRLIFHGSKKAKKKLAEMSERSAQAGEVPPNEISSNTPRGFIFGRNLGYYLIKPEEQDGHILVVGGAGSGKTSCLTIPTLLSWRKRVFVIDVKGNLYDKTKAKRKNVKIFNPTDGGECGYNPFYFLAQSRNLSQSAREIALTIIPLPENVSDPFWVQSAQNVLTAAILYYYELGASFSEAITGIQTTPIDKLIDEILGSGNTAAKMYINQVRDLELKTLAGIATEMSNKIMVFATDPDIKDCLTKADVITPLDLENGFDIYLCIPQDKLTQWKDLLTLIVNQFLEYFKQRTLENPTPILFYLEEFAELGKIPTVLNGLATLRERGVTICLVCQSLAQPDFIYGKDVRRAIMDNVSYTAILKATDADTQDYFSRLVGTWDKPYQSSSESYSEILQLPTGTSVSIKPEEKRIIKPEEFATLDDIVLLSPYGFMRAEKTPYYKHSAFQQ